MPFQPSGTLYLIGSVPLDNTYEHTIDFTNLTEQINYFLGKVKHTVDKVTYIRETGQIRVGLNLESIRDCNYAMYRNKTDTKWIFVFINAKTYANENVAILDVETDVFQTYQFDFTWRDSFIEREHQDRWSGVNLPIFNVNEEELTLGDEYIKEAETVIATSGEFYLVVTSQPFEGGLPNVVQNYPTPLCYYLVTSQDIQALSEVLSEKPEVLSISLINYLPDGLVLGNLPAVNITPTGGNTAHLYRINSSQTVSKVLGTVNKYFGLTLPQAFGTGLARNPMYESKLLVYPFNYLMLTDIQGDPFILKTEYLTGDTIEVKCSQGLAFNVKTRYFISSGYLGETDGKMHSLINDTVNDLPLKTNEYYNYMLTHRAQIATNMALGVAEGVTNAGFGALMGVHGGMMMAGGVLQAGASVAQELARQKDLKATPESVRHFGNNLTFDLAEGNTKVKLYRFGLATQIKKILADYFAKYGYKCGEVKNPNLRSRYYYNYVKCIGANLDGDFDLNDLRKLKSIFDNGVTLWHNRAGVTPLDYTYDNVEMSLL